MHGNNDQAIIITTKITKVVFDRIFVYSGDSLPVDNTVTVQKAHSCFALAVFKTKVSSSSSEIGTYQYPRIPKWEWPVIIAEIIKEITVKGNGEIFEYLSPKVIAGTEPAVLKKAVSDIGTRIAELDKIKSVIAKLITDKKK
jgi:hypothetical protein